MRNLLSTENRIRLQVDNHDQGVALNTVNASSNDTAGRRSGTFASTALKMNSLIISWAVPNIRIWSGRCPPGLSRVGAYRRVLGSVLGQAFGGRKPNTST